MSPVPDLMGDDGRDAQLAAGLHDLQQKLFGIEARVNIEGNDWDDPMPEEPGKTFAQQRDEWRQRLDRAERLYPEALDRLNAKVEQATTSPEPQVKSADLRKGDEIGLKLGGKVEWGVVHNRFKGVANVMLDNGDLHAAHDDAQLVPSRALAKRLSTSRRKVTNR